MMCHSVQPRDQAFVKGYGFLSFAKNMGKNFGKKSIKNLTSKYSQKLLDHAEQSATDASKTAWKRAIKKITDTTGDLIGNKIADKITKVSKLHYKIVQRDLKAEITIFDREIPKERYLSPKNRQKMVDDLRLIW